MSQKIKSQVLSVAFKVLHGQGSGCNATSIIILLLPHSSLSHDLPVIPQTSQGLSDSGPFYLLIYLFPQIAACYFFFLFLFFFFCGGRQFSAIWQLLKEAFNDHCIGNSKSHYFPDLFPVFSSFIVFFSISLLSVSLSRMRL